jgi:hypothetical protein
VINDRISQQEFIRQAIDLAFKDRGLKTWRELAPPKKKKVTPFAGLPKITCPP